MRDDAADVTFTNTYADAQALARGELDPRVLFMQGRTKMAGDMGKVLALMPVVQQRRAPRAARGGVEADRLLTGDHREGALVVGGLDVVEGDACRVR